jgi:hypothetical protein
MVTHICITRTEEAETGRLGVDFEASPTTQGALSQRIKTKTKQNQKPTETKQKQKEKK